MAVWGEYMESMLRQQIQAACDAVHRDPDDPAASQRLQRLLSAAATDRAETESAPDWHRLVRTACDEVYDAPENADARNRLLMLLRARESGSPPAPDLADRSARPPGPAQTHAPGRGNRHTRNP